MAKDNLIRCTSRAWLQALIAAIYPPQCLSCNGMVGSDYALCSKCWRETPFIVGLVCVKCGIGIMGDTDEPAPLCQDCSDFPRVWRAGRAALEYRDNARSLLLSFKHGDRMDLARPAAGWMMHAGQDLLSHDKVLLPIPLHWRRLFTRRYNQAALLAKEIARKSGADYYPDLLERRFSTGTQEGRNRLERYEKMQSAFRVKPRYHQLLLGREVVLIDDVMTSGATFSNAARVCYAHGAKTVDVLSLARVAKSF